MATAEEMVYEYKLRNLVENITKKPASMVLSTPINELFHKIDDRDFYCAITGKKIEKFGYYSKQTLKVYSSFGLAQTYTNKDMDECGIKELRGEIVEKCPIKKLRDYRKNYFLIENNNPSS